LKELIGKYVKQTDRILNIGSGNSRLSEEMHDDGYKQIVNIDFSPICVAAMKEKYKGRDGLNCNRVL
jgi:2-polyprenyl-3-methyl-5-hydroxy-6-metoxy-1,4-benzoquinol methylase